MICRRYTVAVTASSSQSKENASSNNNSALLRNQSEYDDRANRPLLPANLSPIEGGFVCEMSLIIDVCHSREATNIRTMCDQAI